MHQSHLGYPGVSWALFVGYPGVSWGIRGYPVPLWPDTTEPHSHNCMPQIVSSLRPNIKNQKNLNKVRASLRSRKAHENLCRTSYIIILEEENWLPRTISHEQWHGAAVLQRHAASRILQTACSSLQTTRSCCSCAPLWRGFRAERLVRKSQHLQYENGYVLFCRTGK